MKTLLVLDLLVLWRWHSRRPVLVYRRLPVSVPYQSQSLCGAPLHALRIRRLAAEVAFRAGWQCPVLCRWFSPGRKPGTRHIRQPLRPSTRTVPLELHAASVRGLQSLRRQKGFLDENLDSRPLRIDAFRVLQCAGDLAKLASAALGVIDLYFHGSPAPSFSKPSWRSFSRGRRTLFGPSPKAVVLGKHLREVHHLVLDPGFIGDPLGERVILAAETGLEVEHPLEVPYPLADRGPVPLPSNPLPW